MPPRGAGKAEEAEEAANPDAAEHERLQGLAFDSVLSRTRRLAASSLPPTKQMLRADGKDIVKKASTRRGRYLLVFNFQLAPAAAGKLGTLAALDTKNPVLYLDFPQGRYKMLGTLVFPRNKYLVLRLGQREVLCEDVLDCLVVFSEGYWVGSAEDNPEERRLPEPDWLAAPRLHSKFDFSGRGEPGAAAGKEDGADAEGDEGEEEEPPSQRPQRRASRAAGGKRLRYNEDGDGEGGSSDASSDEEEGCAPRKLPRLGSQVARQGRASQARQQPDSHPIDLAGGGSEDEDDAPPAARGTLDGFVRRGGGQAPRAKPGSAGRPKPAARQRMAPSSGSDGERDVVDLAGSDGDDDEEAPPSSARPRSQRRAAGAASKKLRVVDSSEEEGGSEAAASDAPSVGEGSEADESGGGSSSDGGGSEYAPSD